MSVRLVIESQAELLKFKKVLVRRAAVRTIKRNPIQVTRSGNVYRARLAGHADAAFGLTPTEARQRLVKVQVMPPHYPKDCDRLADKLEMRGNWA